MKKDFDRIARRLEHKLSEMGWETGGDVIICRKCSSRTNDPECNYCGICGSKLNRDDSDKERVICDLKEALKFALE